MIKLGVRGSVDSVNHILIKIDDLTLMTTENLFLAGQEYREKTGENLVQLLNSLSKDHEISIKSNVVDEIENVLGLKNGELQQWIK
jgi:pentose-5-phosphate-3-epimerase